MKAILPEFDKESLQPLYLQLFHHIRGMILSHDIVPGEKLPSLRNLSESLEISLTTVSQAYDQLLVEGYVHSEPKKGYFVSSMYYPSTGQDSSPAAPLAVKAPSPETPKMAYDLSSFDFVKWKKCISRVLNEYPETLLFESDPQGEEALRYEITKYVYSARGVRCTPDRVVIAAGTQQITAHIATILRLMGIENVALEDPGYGPVYSMFRDRGFAISKVPVGSDGIAIEKLPMNIPGAAYVSPQNQFPTGAMMPVARRYQLLAWAEANDSYIIEDDYDSELRYFGKPALALQGIDKSGRVVYLGSFSSTLFASMKISYMILPPAMAEIYKQIQRDYTQSCSKTEQLALALFMESGAYQTGIKKLRRLYAQKLRSTVRAFSKYPFIRPRDTNSGVGLILDIRVPAGKAGADDSAADVSLPEEGLAARLVEDAKELGISASILDTPLPGEADAPADADYARIYLYYSAIPLADIPSTIESLAEKWYHSIDRH